MKPCPNCNGAGWIVPVDEGGSDPPYRCPACIDKPKPNRARCICTDFLNFNPDPVPNPDCPLHGAGFAT